MLWKRVVKNNNSVIQPLHLFRALLDDKTVLAIMVRLGVSPVALKNIIDRQINRQAVKIKPGSEPALSMEFKQIIFRFRKRLEK